ncbi:MAG: DUF2726 domain-containing protein [Verrucomicrobia bacterium]|nr:DUF2726 domain-containing protein [Verrucomicrobiota bacterium]
MTRAPNSLGSHHLVCYKPLHSLRLLQYIDPWTAVLCCIGSAGILLLILACGHFLQPKVQVEPVDTLLTAAEQKFYEALDSAIDGRFVILSKVRLADLFVLTSRSRSARYRVFRSIACKHVDFVLAEIENLHPIAAIELDDSSHQRTHRRLRDELLDDLFAKAAFPLLRFRTAASYNPRAIEERVEEVVKL